jgi:hypothetical protein
LDVPLALAVDIATNVYVANSGNKTIEEWNVANSNVTILVSGLNDPEGVAVDGAGNIYIGCNADKAIMKWTAASGSLSTLVSSGLNAPIGVAVDFAGNVYFADTANNAIKELPYVLVDPTPKLETASAGTDALPVVLPATENLRPPFAPTSDQLWLAVTGITNGVVSFSFTANTGPSRTAHITLFGQSIPITQAAIGRPPTLTGFQTQGNGVFQLTFTNDPSASFTVLCSTNLYLPLSNWTVVGAASNTGGGQFQFTARPATNAGQSFYVVRSP